MAIDYAARLEKVSAAITSILDGGVSSATLDDGTSVTKLDLGWLTQEEKRLSALVARQSRPRGAFRSAVPR